MATSTTTTGSVFDGDAIGVCKYFYNNYANTSDPTIQRVTKLTGWTTANDVFGRENGVRMMASIVAEIAVYQNWNVFGMLEGAPFQAERAFFTNQFAHSMFDTDFNLYFKLGLSYKF
jgi:hypothetical protein